MSTIRVASDIDLPFGKGNTHYSLSEVRRGVDNGACNDGDSLKRKTCTVMYGNDSRVQEYSALGGLVGNEYGTPGSLSYSFRASATTKHKLGIV